VSPVSSELVSIRHLASAVTRAGSTLHQRCSMRLKCGIERREQLGIAERLEQTLDGALFEQPRTDNLASVGGDEDDRNLLPTPRQLPLKIGSGHARHGDVE